MAIELLIYVVIGSVIGVTVAPFLIKEFNYIEPKGWADRFGDRATLGFFLVIAAALWPVVFIYLLLWAVGEVVTWAYRGRN